MGADVDADRTEYRAVRGFPPGRFRIGSDRSVFANDTPPDLPPPWNAPRWRRLKIQAPGRVELRHAGRVSSRSVDRLFRAAFPVVAPVPPLRAPAPATIAAAEVPADVVELVPSSPPAEAPAPAPAVVVELAVGQVEHALAGDGRPRGVEFFPIAGFPGCEVGSDFSVWSQWTRHGMVPQWHQLRPRIPPRRISPTVMLRSGEGHYVARSVGALYRAAVVARLPIGPPRTVVAPRGESHGRAVLTEAKVIEARRLRSEGWAYHELGVRYGVSEGTVLAAVSGKTWRHVPMEPETPVRR